MSPTTANEKDPGGGVCVAHPATNSAAAAIAAARSIIGDALQPVESFQRLARRELVQLERGKLAAQRIVGGRRGGRAAEEVVLRARGTQLLLEPRQVLARRAHHILGD